LKELYAFNLAAQEEYDTYGDGSAQLPLQWKRRKIIEIVAASDLIFVLSESGLCGAFSRSKSHSLTQIGLLCYVMFLINLLIMLAATNKHVCHLNTSRGEVIRSLFYNKNNDSLITVSMYESERFVSLKCRTTPIE
jgi:hypothetical protein